MTTPELIPNPSYDKITFIFKLREMGFEDGVATEILGPLPETFTLEDIRKNVGTARSNPSV